MKKSVGVNYVYNLIYQLLITIIPLILIPFLARSLTDVGTGEHAFNNSIMLYFSYLALLGVNLYGTKVIAASKDEYSEKKAFIEILLLKVFTAIVSIILYFIFIYFVIDNNILLVINGIVLFANLIDITWFFQGKENFKSIVVRNSIVRISGLVLVLLLVRTPEDVWKYTLILAGLEFLGQLIMWFDIRKARLFGNIKNLNLKPFSHFKGTLLLFLPQLIIQIYTIMNTTIIGAFTGDKGQVGVFDMSSRVINVSLMIITALGTVLVPRISQLHRDNDKTEITRLLSRSVVLLTYLSIPIAIGLAVAAPYFVPWFFGETFTDMVLIMQLFSIKIILVTFSNIFGIQYMIPTEKNRQFIISVGAGAAVNLVLNIILINFFGVLGVVVGTLVAEVVVTMIQYFYIRKEVNIFANYIEILKSLFASLIMGTIVLLISVGFAEQVKSNLLNYFGDFISGAIVNIGIIIIGVIVYAIVNLVIKHKQQKEILNRVFSILRRNAEK